jgi:hypothetical protein
MADLVKKLPSILLVLVGVIMVVASTLVNAVYTSYIGLGLIFWGIILGLIITEFPSAPEEIKNQTNVEDLRDQLSEEQDENSDVIQYAGLEKAAQPIQESCVVQEGKLLEPIQNETLNHFLTKTLGLSPQIVSEEQAKFPLNSGFNTKEKTLQYNWGTKKTGWFENGEPSKDDVRKNNLPPPPPMILPDQQDKYYADKERDKKVNEVFEELEQSRQMYEKQLDLKKLERINSKQKHYTEDVTKCPLRRPDKQDCFFCEAKSCQDRKILETK